MQRESAVVVDEAMDILRAHALDERVPPRTAEAGCWPNPLRPEAYHGIVGEIVRMIEPHSEADPVALLMHLLVAFGNIVGRAAHFVIGGTTHHTNLNCVLVGATASRKGTAKDDTFFVIRNGDTDWSDRRVQSGLSSGEGFVWAVHDEISRFEKRAKSSITRRSSSTQVSPTSVSWSWNRSSPLFSASFNVMAIPYRHRSGKPGIAATSAF